MSSDDMLIHFSSNSNQSDSSLPTKLAKLEARMAGKGSSSAVAPVQAQWQSGSAVKFEGMKDCVDPLSSSDSDDDDVTMILNEVLRLYPPLHAMFRQTAQKTSLGGISLPANVDLYLPTILIHHDPEIWGEDSAEFKPERFLSGISSASKEHLAFYPFGWGPRVCIGQSFTTIEAKIALSMILQRFSFELSPSYTHAPRTVISLQPQFGAQIILHQL